MIFQIKHYSVFLFVVTYLQQLSASLTMHNVTLFAFNHPSNCKHNEFYILDNFSCSPCDSKANLQPSADGLTCECASDSEIIANYDTYFQRPICAKLCRSTKLNKCPITTTLLLPKDSCNLKYVNFTADQVGAVALKHIRIYSPSRNPISDCICDLKYNYHYGNYCIWKGLLKKYLNYNAFWQRGRIYADLKFTAFFCQSLQNRTACNQLANLCVQSFFDTDKNSPCSVFLLAQASDAALYSSVGEELHDFRPYLFYKRGKDTVHEMDKRISYPIKSKPSRELQGDALELLTTVYSLDGHLIRLGQLRLNHVNLCGHNSHELTINFRYFKNYRISCELSMETIIELASMYSNRQYFNVFLNHTRADNLKYVQAIPVLIENAFEGNMKQDIGEWQLVKRFQMIGAHPTDMSTSRQMPVYDNSHKLRLFKSIRILRKFELRCFVTEDDKLSIPLIILNYNQIDISLNSSLNELFKFELIIGFERERSLTMLYKISLPIFLTIGFGFAIFRSYTLKCRRSMECCDMIIVLKFCLCLMSNIGNSLMATVLVDVFYTIFIFLTRIHVMPVRNDNVLEFFIYSALGLKGIYFGVSYWKLAHVDVFFVDWERPKGSDALVHLKTNLETSSQCSSIRALAENNVSAWRIFFVAKQWIELSGQQTTSSFMQGLICLTVYAVTSYEYPLFYSDALHRLFFCIVTYSVVHMVQRIFRHLILNQLMGSPLQKLMDICAMANVSIITFLDSSYGFYIHGRSPHGFSDTDMSSMILQLQRESQNMCGKRGLLSDSDFQTYVMLPPFNLRSQIEKLLPQQQKSEYVSHFHFQKELRFFGNHCEGTLESGATAFNRVNRFICAFIDHAIKDMDYIIKEKSFVENLLGCEFESFLTENKGTFYIDNGLTFGSLFLYGNQMQIFLMEVLMLIAINILSNSFVTSIVVVCICNKIFFRIWVRDNVATKTLIDKRFLM